MSVGKVAAACCDRGFNLRKLFVFVHLERSFRVFIVVYF